MRKSATAASLRQPWDEKAKSELIERKLRAEPTADIARAMGRTKNAVEQKVSELRALGEVPLHIPRWVELRPNAGPLYVVACLGQGGFPALTPTGNPRTSLGVRYPLTWPARL